ncbi:MAG TPA: NUDIX hydrolase [Solirubrobacteraceae bacterium]
MTVVFRGKWFEVEQQPIVLGNGERIIAEWVSRTDGVRVIARRKDGAVLITNEYRSELATRDYRLPGGKVENGDTPLQAAIGELREETGFRAAEWIPLCNTQAFAMVRYSLHYFEARTLALDPIQHDEGEDIRVEWFTLEEAVRMALDGRIGEDLSAFQILRLASREGQLREMTPTSA